ncbi:sensor histidine kinase [Beggiatoa leptomitoformis]|uniref:histidine kinase n=1 Tax=Beggiatoa leptomitoformis TaxID=288004 RepID=A0A2N9YFI6_9GAMM|nr:HAMP domain-containing sensor histidine kinase [Beggiatoa leptomitoformis]ALG68528.1 GHKL domain-containing protein [Beggiatoa leptomitoformis]AUI69129.1 GHKL domain-containing protein [Beggiatoa leptomitoformis]
MSFFLSPISEEVKSSSLFNPYLYTFAFASLYLLYCLLYIWLSSEIASHFAFSIQELTSIEQWKGTVFVFVTTLFISVILLLTLKRIEEYQNQILHQQNLLIQSERRATAGIFAASVAHDMNNYLFSMSGAIELIKESPSLNITDKQQQLLNSVEVGLQALMNLSTSLVSVEQETLQRDVTLIDINNFIEEIIGLTKHHQRVKKCTVRLEPMQLPQVLVDVNLIKQALINLIINAADAIQHPEGVILFKTALTHQQLLIEVHDNGTGIPENLRQKVFEPFFTTKNNGSGLGLLSVKVCMDKHHGNIKITNSASLGGCCIQLAFPLN